VKRRPITSLLLFLIFLMVPLRTHCQKQSAGRNDTLDADESNLARWIPRFYRDWLIRDVGYIITKQERRAFLELTTDEDREDFIENFWRLRNPDPSSHENLYELEYYRRIVYANEHFSVAEREGWTTDRGRVYITWGQPDQVQTNLDSENGRQEGWHYRYLEGIGADIELKFVDSRQSGDYRLIFRPEDREILFKPIDPDLRRSENSSEESPVKFKDLEAIAITHVNSRRFQSEFSVEELPATLGMSLVAIQIEVPPSEFQRRFRDSGQLNMFCSFVAANGRLIQILEETVYPVDIYSAGSAIEEFALRKTVPLRPGSYELAIILKDVASQDVATTYTRLVVSGQPTTFDITHETAQHSDTDLREQYDAWLQNIDCLVGAEDQVSCVVWSR
jgi:GWxTD domain-containing protein